MTAPPYPQTGFKRFLRCLFARVRYDVKGLEHLSEPGPVIIIMNHTGWEEILISVLASPGPIRILGMRELMFLDDQGGRARILATHYAQDAGAGFRALIIWLGRLLGPGIRWLLRRFGFIPVRVHTQVWKPLLGGNGIRETLAALEQGCLVLIFPEAGYNRNEVMTPFRPGIGLILRMLERRGIRPEVIPAAQHTAGCVSLAFGSRYIPRMVFGAPLDWWAAEMEHDDFDALIARRLQDRVAGLLSDGWPDHPAQTYSLAQGPEEGG